MLKFSDEDIKKISQISKFIIDNLKRNDRFDFQKYQDDINKIVSKYIKKSI
jgi:hypothetical protein